MVPKSYTTSILAPMFSLIWMVMFILYWRIWREATCHARRMRANTCCPTGGNDWKSIQVNLYNYRFRYIKKRYPRYKKKNYNIDFQQLSDYVQYN